MMMENNKSDLQRKPTFTVYMRVDNVRDDKTKKIAEERNE